MGLLHSVIGLNIAAFRRYDCDPLYVRVSVRSSCYFRDDVDVSELECPAKEVATKARDVEATTNRNLRRGP
jgi:hypothetical protein